MKHQFKKTTLTILLCSFASIAAIDLVTPYYSIRSQGVNAARVLAGLEHHVNLYDKTNIYGTIAVSGGYTRSFDNKHITRCLFGNDLIGQCKDRIKITGSRVAARDETDWLADYFGLPTDFESVITFDPRIENAIFDFNYYLGLDDWMTGLYFRINAPLVHTTWDLNMCELMINAGTNAHDPGYFDGSTTGTPRTDLLDNFTQYALGDCKQKSTPTLATDVTFEKLKNAKIPCNSKSKTQIADFNVILGWNVIQNERHHFGVNFRVVAPTGNAPKGEYLFEPIAGNGSHWETGFGLTMHRQFMYRDEGKKSLGLYSTLNVTHLFEAGQRRTFDVIGKPMSRYALASKFGTPAVSKNLQGGGVTPLDGNSNATEFLNIYTPVANITNVPVRVSVGAQVDFVLMLNARRNNVSFDFGYNLWARGCEKIKLRRGCPNRLEVESNTWTLKGDSHMFGFARANVVAGGGFPAITANDPIQLSATQNESDIHTGRNFVAPFVVATAIKNPNIDNPQLATTGVAGGTQVDASPGVNNQTNTSIHPQFVSLSDVGLQSGRTRGLSHKVFGHLSYNLFNDSDDYVPYIGIGAEGEFGRNEEPEDPNKPDCAFVNTECPPCLHCSLSQWGVWIKGGVSF